MTKKYWRRVPAAKANRVGGVQRLRRSPILAPEVSCIFGLEQRGRFRDHRQLILSNCSSSTSALIELEHQIDKNGGIHLKPLSSKRKGKKIRALVSFKPRSSRFDRYNADLPKDPFRGFYTLFWIGMAILMLNTFYTSFTSTGQVISLTFATLLSKDAGVLALSDGILVGSLFLCVPFAKALKHGWIRYWPTGSIIQHAWQGAMLGCVIKWARYREWPWVQSGFFVLHTLSMMMKMHSYLAVNGAMSQASSRLKRYEKQLEERLMEIERSDAGILTNDDSTNSSISTLPDQQKELNTHWIKAVKQAREAPDAHPDEVKLLFDKKSEDGDIPAWTLLEHQRGMTAYRHKAVKGSVIRHKADPSPSHSRSDKGPNDPVLATPQNIDQAVQGQTKTSVKASSNQQQQQHHHHEEVVRDPHPLVTHPDPIISSMAREIETQREELMSVAPHRPEIDDADVEGAGGLENPEGQGKQSRVCWPENVTYANFWDYLLVPTLVYELEYPRTKSVRPLYVLEKTLATFGTFFVIYVITEHFIIPHSPTKDTPLLPIFLKLALPMMVNYLLIFYIMFECVCNGFAEFTRFADREFYEDWWNSKSMDEFSRRWNKPVHSFLLKHVYASSITSFGFSKTSAMFTTFLLSAFLHELVMAIVSGKIRGYLFAAQMAQLPLILIGKIPIVKRNETLGNLIFWIGLMAGFPLLNIGYLIY